jgi:predicted nuclease of predicted toxin-antitoxin system
LKVLFDEDVPRKLARSLPRHEIHTVVSMQWGGIGNGALLKLIERERFDVFLTGDENMEDQQRLEGRPFAVMIMSAINWPVVRPHVHRISEALGGALEGTVSEDYRLRRVRCAYQPRIERRWMTAYRKGPVSSAEDPDTWRKGQRPSSFWTWPERF